MSGWELTEKHYDVLQWIADGCPEREDVNAMKTNAAVLNARGLVKVRRQPWRAHLTDEGRRVLGLRGVRTAKKRSASPPQRRPAQPSDSPKPRRQARKPIPDLRAEVEASGGTLTIPSPSEGERRRYRQAFYMVIQKGVLPPNRRMRQKGRDSGDLVFWIETFDPDEDAQKELEKKRLKEQRIDLPEYIENPHRLVSRRVKAGQTRGRVADRKLRFIHVLATALEEQGYSVTGEDFSISASTTDDIVMEFVVSDQTDREPDLDSDGEQKEIWGRKQWKRTPNGKIQVAYGQRYYNLKTWADKVSWTIAAKVPEIVKLADDQVTETRKEREEAEHAKAQRLAEWEAAVPRARVEFTRQHNLDRAKKQMEKWSEAEQLRAYAAAVAEAANQLSGDEHDLAVEWSAWLQSQAKTIDPTGDPVRLRWDPKKGDDWEISKYMPRGWSAHHPPDK